MASDNDWGELENLPNEVEEEKRPEIPQESILNQYTRNMEARAKRLAEQSAQAKKARRKTTFANTAVIKRNTTVRKVVNNVPQNNVAIVNETWELNRIPIDRENRSKPGIRRRPLPPPLPHSKFRTNNDRNAVALGQAKALERAHEFRRANDAFAIKLAANEKAEQTRNQLEGGKRRTTKRTRKIRRSH